jgi:hypothetical protein
MYFTRVLGFLCDEDVLCGLLRCDVFSIVDGYLHYLQDCMVVQLRRSQSTNTFLVWRGKLSDAVRFDMYTVSV